jgi:hypothetical protein
MATTTSSACITEVFVEILMYQMCAPFHLEGGLRYAIVPGIQLMGFFPCFQGTRLC